jgi:Na+-translocating ferredoxin:NAD+ oxidoreductase RNF subunit RnfB
MKAEEIAQILPGVNCGACGYRGCWECAVAIAAGEALPAACPAGGAAMAEAVGSLVASGSGKA